MIRFCDKEVYNITEGEITREQLLRFYLKSKMNRAAVVAIYRKDGTYKGKITYQELLESGQLEDCIDTNTIMISENFWKEAKAFLGENRKRLLTIVDRNGRILGFAYNDTFELYTEINSALTALEKECVLPEQYSRVQMVVITDLNELGWRCYKLFANAGLAVCVIGEKWEWFGFHSGEGYLKYPDYAKLYLYAEGTEPVREELEHKKSYYPNVLKSFLFIKDLAVECSKIAYKQAIEQLKEKGVTICECSIPEKDEINYKTADEWQSIAQGLDLGAYTSNAYVYTEANKECLYRIYGMDNVINLIGGIQRNREMVPLGEIQGVSVKGYRFCRRIYLIGPCIADGYGCLDSDTLYGYLQSYIDKYEYQVVTVPISILHPDIWKCISSLPIREQDIVLSINHSDWLLEEHNCRRIELKSIYENKNRGNMFCYMPIHTNAEGNRCIIEEIMDKFLLNKINELSCKEGNGYIQKGELLNLDTVRAIDEYIECIRTKDCQKIGAIVMNGNPFTKGHRYLIEYAANDVEKLYVFVVEENRSYFKFNDRFEMIRKGTNDIPNVIVVPSGEWVLSYKTMPVYFEKEMVKKTKIDAQYDLEIFARYIAPKLGITKRFVGEEPLDLVTGQYNEQMKELLPLFGVEVEEIPRMQIKGEAVSASRVRECMQDEKWGELKEFVPASTYEICRKYGNRCC